MIGPVLIGLSFLIPPAAGAYRTYALNGGLGVLALGLILATAQTLRRRRGGDASVGVRDTRPAATADVGVAEPAAPVAPPRAEATLRVGGNAASEPWVRWYYVAAATATEVRAAKARVGVVVRGEPVSAEHWLWDSGARAIDLSQTGARIPIVIGAVREPVQPIAGGWVVPFRNWYLTPSAHSALGPFLAPFIAGFRHVFDVTISWVEAGHAQTASASFELRFWREPTSEPRFIRLGERPSYRDQLGGFVELRDRGAALRKDGLMLSVSALNVWLGKVETWTREARDLIAEVSVADSDVFARLGTKDAPMFEGIRLHNEKHRLALRGLHVRLDHLSRFIRP